MENGSGSILELKELCAEFCYRCELQNFASQNSGEHFPHGKNSTFSLATEKYRVAKNFDPFRWMRSQWNFHCAAVNATLWRNFLTRASQKSHRDSGVRTIQITALFLPRVSLIHFWFKLKQIDETLTLSRNDDLQSHKNDSVIVMIYRTTIVIQWLQWFTEPQ